MNSSKPYLLQALFDWIVDNACTPHIVVNAGSDGVMVPEQYVNKNGEIVLNIAPEAVDRFEMDKECVSFTARFGGVSQSIYVPIFAILGIYARENGRGMMFEADPEPDPNPEPPKDKDDKSGTAEVADIGAKRPSLRVVK